MAKNRKNQSAAVRFGPMLKVLFLCLLIVGSAIGYVWQKTQIYQLGKQIREKESRLMQLTRDDRMLEARLADLRSPVKLDQGARGLGLVPAQPGQIVRLVEMPARLPDNQNTFRQLATRPDGATQ
jgi:hypothetical protein